MKPARPETSTHPGYTRRRRRPRKLGGIHISTSPTLLVCFPLCRRAIPPEGQGSRCHLSLAPSRTPRFRSFLLPPSSNDQTTMYLIDYLILETIQKQTMRTPQGRGPETSNSASAGVRGSPTLVPESSSSVWGTWRVHAAVRRNAAVGTNRLGAWRVSQ